MNVYMAGHVHRMPHSRCKARISIRMRHTILRTLPGFECVNQIVMRCEMLRIFRENQLTQCYRFDCACSRRTVAFITGELAKSKKELRLEIVGKGADEPPQRDNVLFARTEKAVVLHSGALTLIPRFDGLDVEPLVLRHL